MTSRPLHKKQHRAGLARSGVNDTQSDGWPGLDLNPNPIVVEFTHGYDSFEPLKTIIRELTAMRKHRQKATSHGA
jgi:hypothetical protein